MLFNNIKYFSQLDFPCFCGKTAQKKGTSHAHSLDIKKEGATAPSQRVRNKAEVNNLLVEFAPCKHYILKKSVCQSQNKKGRFLCPYVY